ncbi:MAG: UDP-glucose/GDP-mannose dehydrogenase family protein [Candidatus Omnitrophica bacterium]|nr:UDP-glucose/GDP-mannose dehydrogenase family protein [Candidatus Omnitrophota bacterium]
MKTIGIIGTGHVGLVTGACFAKLGNIVSCFDSDFEKIEKLKKNIIPFYEPGLSEIVKIQKEKKKLFFTHSIEDVVSASEIIFICVGTPSNPDGKADLSFVEQASIQIANALKKMKDKKSSKKNYYRLIVEKSTVPVLTGQWVKRTIELIAPTGIDFDVAANPEFLKEGSAIRDFFYPDRIVVGVENERAKKIFKQLYKPLNAPMIFTDIKSAEIIKHASNSFLAMKISYINAISRICDKVGADIEKIAQGMGADKRIGKDFLKAGIGYGGSCFPKDIRAFISIAEELGCDLDILKEVEKINTEQRKIVVKKAREFLWNLKDKNIGVLGLSFKPETDDIRESPAIEIIKLFFQEGCLIKCYDPKAMENTKKILPNIEYGKNAYDVAENSHLLIFATEWEEFKRLNFKRIHKLMKTPYIIDGRNFLNLEKLKEIGFICCGIGKKPGGL